MTKYNLSNYTKHYPALENFLVGMFQGYFKMTVRDKVAQTLSTINIFAEEDTFEVEFSISFVGADILACLGQEKQDE